MPCLKRKNQNSSSSIVKKAETTTTTDKHNECGYWDSILKQKNRINHLYYTVRLLRKHEDPHYDFQENIKIKTVSRKLQVLSY
jgi:hypothetical protein